MTFIAGTRGDETSLQLWRKIEGEKMWEVRPLSLRRTGCVLVDGAENFDIDPDYIDSVDWFIGVVQGYTHPHERQVVCARDSEVARLCVTVVGRPTVDCITMTFVACLSGGTQLQLWRRADDGEWARCASKLWRFMVLLANGDETFQISDVHCFEYVDSFIHTVNMYNRRAPALSAAEALIRLNDTCVQDTTGKRISDDTKEPDKYHHGQSPCDQTLRQGPHRAEEAGGRCACKAW